MAREERNMRLRIERVAAPDGQFRCPYTRSLILSDGNLRPPTPTPYTLFVYSVGLDGFTYFRPNIGTDVESAETIFSLVKAKGWKDDDGGVPILDYYSLNPADVLIPLLLKREMDFDVYKVMVPPRVTGHANQPIYVGIEARRSPSHKRKGPKNGAKRSRGR
jgi:hypothetical protein